MGGNDLFSSLLGGGQEDEEEQPQASQADGLLGGLLGSLMGGQQAQGDDPGLGGLVGGLGSLLGGGGQTGSLGGLLGGGGQSGGLLGGLLGGGGSATLANSLAAPLAAGLAEKLNIPVETAQMIASFAIAKILPVIMDRIQGGQAARTSHVSDSGLDMDDLVHRMGSHGTLGHDYFESTGLAHELAEQAGIDDETAEQGLEETFKLLGDRLGTGPEDGPGLDDLFDDWGR